MKDNLKIGLFIIAGLVASALLTLLVVNVGNKAEDSFDNYVGKQEVEKVEKVKKPKKKTIDLTADLSNEEIHFLQSKFRKYVDEGSLVNYSCPSCSIEEVVIQVFTTMGTELTSEELNERSSVDGRKLKDILKDAKKAKMKEVSKDDKIISDTQIVKEDLTSKILVNQE